LVFGVVLITNEMIDFKIVLTLKNILTGISVSVFIGIIAGLIPAILASRLNPVEAIRTN